MRSDYWHRRMVIRKFQNRPPFHLKVKEDQPVIDRRSFVQNSRKTLENLEKKYTENFEIQIDNKTRNIIPKIIDSFQKMTPTKKVERITDSGSSMQTLFRNNKISNHHIMNKLLDNTIEDTVKKSYNYNIDTIPSKDVYPRFKVNLKNNAAVVRVDKKTSTTGLDSNDFENNLPHGKCKDVKSKIPQRKRCSKESIQKKRTRTLSSPSSQVDIILTKDYINDPTIVTPFAKGRQKTFILEANKSSQKCNRTSKGFVSKQVEKYNRFGLRVTQKTKSTSNGPQNVDYIDMMSSIRETYPMLANKTDNPLDHRDWSDNSSVPRHKISFPRETRGAMEKLMNEARSPTKRKPLSKFVKTKDMHLQPAIAFDHNQKNKLCQSK